MARLGSLFRKRRAPDPDQWQPGDQAECIGEGRWWDRGIEPTSGPHKGEVRLVARVVEAKCDALPSKATFLVFDRYGSNGFIASAFRKVRPQTEERKTAEAEFTKLIRRQVAPAAPQREEVG
tara:strand:- start:1291 stop:1656 length:366 start_codon:yes stop_codon:yes gene_type:complete